MAAYLVGSIPWGVLIGLTAQGVDIRHQGSGSMGATNVLRTLGLRLSLVVFLLDLLKGVVAVLFARWLASGALISGYPLFEPLPNTATAEVAAGLAAAMGHNWPLYVRFRGGKGVATSLGALLAISPLTGTVAFLVGILTIAVSRYASVGSMVGAAAGVAGLVALHFWIGYPWHYVAYGLMALALILVRHGANLQRLAKGTEPRVSLTPGQVTLPSHEVRNLHRAP